MKSIYGERTCGDMPKDSPSKSCRPCIDESAVLQMSECSPTLVRSSVLKSGTQRRRIARVDTPAAGSVEAVWLGRVEFQGVR